MTNPIINFTKEKVQAFRRSYAHAVEINAQTFRFEDQVVLVSYAKYLIEFLAREFPDA